MMFNPITASVRHLAIPILAMAVLAPAAAQAATLQYIDTSALWSDADGYHSCSLSNTSHASVMVYRALLDGNGTVLDGSLTTPVTVAAGGSTEINDYGSAYGFARCRFGVYNPAIVRATEIVFHPSGGDFEIYATSEGR